LNTSNGAETAKEEYHGPASKPEGLDDLKKSVQGIPRSFKVVVYWPAARLKSVRTFVPPSKRFVA
jgi:hypothetical protein